MKLVSRFLLILVATPALAGQVIVNQGLSSADTFALRDQLAREHEWQEWLRFQQAIKWLEVLPVNCLQVDDRIEIPGIIEAYRKGAENAKEAGFDGVEIHGANGYLLDQFLQDSTNKRTDAYGGSLENRARLLLEVTDAAVSVWGAGRVGVHLAPRADSHDMGDSNRAETFGYVARELGKRGIAFICTREKAGEDSLGPQLKQLFGGVYIANERFTKEQGNAWLAEGKADAVAFGIPYIANPDLVERLRRDAPLNEPKPELFYAQGPAGYTDYPSL